jgi:hypothetical protein
MPYLTPELKGLEKSKGLSKTLTNPEDFPWEVDSGFMNNGSDERAFGEV